MPHSLEVFIHTYFAFSVLISIRRRQFKQVKEAVPMILNVLKAVCLESDEEELDNVFDRAIEIANSIYEVCNKLAVCLF
jgi:hypothetical protein